MSRILMLDDNPIGVELVARALRQRCGHQVVALHDLDDLTAQRCREGFDAAMIDLAFRGTRRTGLDAVLLVADEAPATRIVLFTQGDDSVADLLRDTWHAVPLATAISKSMPLDGILDTVEQVLRTGTAAVDPVLRPLLPPRRAPERSREQYARLIQHAGHAKLWRALVDSGPDPTYRDLSQATGLKINTIRNYRDQITPALSLHDPDAGTLRGMHAFAQRCRPLLAPYISARLGQR